MRVHFIVHESFEAPGAYETWAINQGHDVTYSRVYAGDRLPADAEGIDFLIVMGGPQDPDTTLEACPHFNAKAEQALIASAVKTGKAVIGICLGSQLIGEALGAPFSHSPEKEIGKFPITLTEDGSKDEMFSHFGKTLAVGHWHKDCEEPTYLILTRNTGSSGNKSKQLGIFRGLQVGIEKNDSTFYLIPYLWIT